MNPNRPSAGTYTPGYARAKLGVVIFGLILVTIGFSHLATPLRLVLFGQRTYAEATQAVKAKEGLPDLILTTDGQIDAQQEPRDRSYLFWNEFRFRAADGHLVNVRAPVGSLVKPLYKLLDSDGLPTTDLVYYDPAHPQVVVFPLIVSTWFSAGILIVIGILGIIIGSTLYRWANTPIELPHLPAHPVHHPGDPEDKT